MTFNLPQLRTLPSRLLHSSARKYNIFGPPDPISHLRPVIYYSESLSSPLSSPHHPYSLSEFTPTEPRANDYELQWKLQRQQLDALHHEFWTDSNTRFEAGKDAILSSLPPAATTQDKENALSEFYKQWVMQEKDRTDSYTAEWRRRNMIDILLAARVEYHRFASRMSRIVSFKKSL